VLTEGLRLISRRRFERTGPPQQTRRDIPLAATIGNDGHRLTKPLDNPMVQVDEFSLTQPVDVDFGHFATLSWRKS
jgi:hypothetical protein